MTAPARYQVVHHDCRGMIYIGSPTYSLVPHATSRTDRKVIVDNKQSFLNRSDRGRDLVRNYFHQMHPNKVSTAPFDGRDFSYIPDHPTRESCEKAKMRLKEIAEDGTLLFEKEHGSSFCGRYYLEKIETIQLSPEWNDSYWIDPHTYFALCNLN